MIEHVRSNHLDHENGIGWVAKNVNVTIIDVMDLSIKYSFYGETHFALKSECKPKITYPLSLFSDNQEIKYMKDNLDYKLKTYGI